MSILARNHTKTDSRKANWSTTDTFQVSSIRIFIRNRDRLPSLARVGVRAAQVDERKIETYIYVYGGELAGPGPRLRQAVLSV